MYHSALFHMHAVYTNSLNGLGGALANDQGEFFCGFEQKDGTVTFSKYIQIPASLRGKFELASDNSDRSKPVFVHPKDMNKRGLAAAVWPTVLDARVANNILPRDILKECRVMQVRKDVVGFDKPAIEKAKAMGFSMQAMAALPAPDFGLASADSCEKGHDYGYVSLRKSVRMLTAGLLPGLRRTP